MIDWCAQTPCVAYAAALAACVYFPKYSVWDRVLRSEFYHRACEVINPTKDRDTKTLDEFNNRIIIYLYNIINFIKKHKIYVVFFIPKHQIDRHSVHLHARVVILKLQSDVTNLCVTSAIVQ